MKKYSIILITTFLGLSQHLFAQNERAPMLKREQLLWISPNIESSNAAALSSLYSELPELRGVSDFGLIFYYDKGTLGCPRTPESTRNTMFSTKSVQRFDNTFVSAFFDYRFQNLNNAQWYNLMDGTFRPNAMSDSTPGPFSSEAFFTGVKVGHRINDKHTIGIAANYNIGTSAKSVDLRNINRKLYFDIGPSWMLQQEWGNIGVDLALSHTVEDIRYEQLITEEGQFIFRMEGLWFFNRENFPRTSPINRFIQDAGYTANLKLDLNIGQMMWYNQFGASYTDGFMKLRTTVTEEQFGDQEVLKYTYRSTLKINPQNQIRVNIQNSTLLAYSLVQRSEINEQTRIQKFVTYARNRHSSEVRNTADFTYAYASLRNGNPIDQSWKLEVGGSYFQHVITQRRFPFLFQQTVNIYEGFASFNKNIPTSRFIFDVKPSVSFEKGNGTMNEMINLTGTTARPQEGVQFLPQLKHEFDYLTSTKLGVGLEATIAYPLKNYRQTALFLTARAHHKQAFDTDLKDFSRTYLSLNLGLSF